LPLCPSRLAASKGLQFGDAALVHQVQALSPALVEHLGELLDELICPIHRSRAEIEAEQAFLLLQPPVLRGGAETETRLVVLAEVRVEADQEMPPISKSLKTISFS
jgi:hypothetical protein